MLRLLRGRSDEHDYMQYCGSAESSDMVNLGVLFSMVYFYVARRDFAT